LGEVPLADCLNLLLRDFARRHPGTAFEGQFEGLARSYGDIVDLTVFRCIQESTTNAVRHGAAARVRAEAGEVAEPEGARALQIRIRDDGSGIAPGHRIGLGLSGMRERVEALGGRFALDNGAPGTVVRIAIPIDPEHDGEAEALLVPQEK
jgi:two-component system sensor histidine kinase UhpB